MKYMFLFLCNIYYDTIVVVLRVDVVDVVGGFVCATSYTMSRIVCVRCFVC